MNSIDKVKEFHKVFGQVTNASPCIPDLDTSKLRISLLYEELIELSQAMGVSIHLKEISAKFATEITTEKELYNLKSVTDTLDALTDIQYVLDGAKLACGMYHFHEQAFNEVHRSNMSKLCDNIEDAKSTLSHYENLGYSGTIESVDGKYRVIRSDGKLLKSIKYSPADLEQFIL